MSEEIDNRYYVRRREFLNEDLDLPAFIIGIVEDTRAIPNDDTNQFWNDGTVILDLADCYRRVKFDFCMYDAGERANSLRKINLIAEVVNAVRDAIALEVESRNARPVRTQPATTETDSGTNALDVPQHAVQPVATEPVELKQSRELESSGHT
jgi:hypothetical protein